ncbi:MAG: nitrogenase [Candidatus Omnitrophica bacterium]|nr:nitrogenase [Candidatus Omnitrophota bacterium]
MASVSQSHFVATRNACKLCAPLGAALVFKGIERGMPLLHGSQGCSTYIRRYLISHFREPVDIASSNFSEESAVFGGAKNLAMALRNVTAQYRPALIGIATTCLSETIGEDVPGMIRQVAEGALEGNPVLVHVSTPSYSGSHAEGFTAAIKTVVERLAGERSFASSARQVNIFPGICSPADLRHLKEIVADFGLTGVILPDYSETLDGPAWSDYKELPPGGTPIADIGSMGGSMSSVTLGRIVASEPEKVAGEFLSARFHVSHHAIGLPIGIKETDELMRTFERVSGSVLPEKYRHERGRLIDAMVDGHKYIFEKKAIVYGEEDLVLGMAVFLSEIGMIPVLCASGGKSGNLHRLIDEMIPELKGKIEVADGTDFAGIDEMAERFQPDMVIGNSKGSRIADRLKIPLVRVGFPIHDRIGAQRILHYGYRGALELYDRIVNALLEVKQARAGLGYSYL